MALPAAAVGAEYPSLTVGGEVLSSSISTEHAELIMRGEAGADGDVRRPVVELAWDGAPVGRIVAREGDARYPATAGLVEMDPANDTPEVYLEAFSGGAHCCTEIEVLTKTESSEWAPVDLDSFEGGGGLVADADGDGRYEVVAADDAFAYAFGCYACTSRPLKILGVEGGEKRDRTFDPRFQERHRQYLAQMEEGMTPDDATNGFLAGWVAEKIVLGEGAEAWDVMLKTYDKEDDWGLRTCPDGGTECADDVAVVRPFPDVLREFLNDHGYAF
jgi:hypothetical protein